MAERENAEFRRERERHDDSAAGRRGESPPAPVKWAGGWLFRRRRPAD